MDAELFRALGHPIRLGIMRRLVVEAAATALAAITPTAITPAPAAAVG